MDEDRRNARFGQIFSKCGHVVFIEGSRFPSSGIPREDLDGFAVPDFCTVYDLRKTPGYGDVETETHPSRVSRGQGSVVRGINNSTNKRLLQVEHCPLIPEFGSPVPLKNKGQIWYIWVSPREVKVLPPDGALEWDIPPDHAQTISVLEVTPNSLTARDFAP